MSTKTPMLTRVPEATKESLKRLSSDPDYGNLRTMCEQMLEQFIREKPYRNKAFQWIQPEKRGTPGWTAYNVVVSDDLSQRVKDEAARLEISLTNLLYTALAWWVEKKQ